MLTSIFDSYLDDDTVVFHPPPWVSVVAVVALTLTHLLAVFIYLGIWLASIVALSAVIAFVVWLQVGYVSPINRRSLPGHILLIIALLVHGAEQFRGGYADVVVTSFPNLIQPANIITDASLALSLSLSATVIWLLGGAMAFYHARVGGFIVLLLAVWGLVFPLSHFALLLLPAPAPVWVPGMASGLVVIALAFLSLRFTLNQTRRSPLS